MVQQFQVVIFEMFEMFRIRYTVDPPVDRNEVNDRGIPDHCQDVGATGREAIPTELVEVCALCLQKC